ncbi:MAG: 50S ribosomal protein L11 methyltransferase [Oscillospiraceae bacterium]|nr:50S ribosomal protein L11 methyltransferase [Oscillospiraceae bacterium]
MSGSWTEITIRSSAADIESVAAAATACGSGQFYIEDYSDMDETLPLIGRVDYISEELAALDKSRAALHLYIPEGEDRDRITNSISNLLTQAGLSFEIDASTIPEENWAEGWKQFYHSLKIGERLVIRPSWEEYEAREGEAVVAIDPGSSFGSGTHESTRLCLEFLEEQLRGKESVLDMGCGSGILSLAALALGAESALGADVELHAVKTARENAALNGMSERFSALCGDALTDAAFARSLGGDYDIICANIVADIIIAMAPLFAAKLKGSGLLIAGGIIDSRAAEVKAALSESGLDFLKDRTEKGWLALCFKKREAAERQLRSCDFPAEGGEITTKKAQVSVTPALSELEGIMGLIKEAQALLKSRGVDQWQDGYPEEWIIKRDIEKGTARLVRGGEGELLGFYVLNEEPERAYEAISGGEWLTDGVNYAVLHRICVGGKARGSGLGARMIEEACELSRRHGLESLRTDTHPDNCVMLSLLKRLGFKRCGEVDYGEGFGGLRIAFEKLL